MRAWCGGALVLSAAALAGCASVGDMLPSMPSMAGLGGTCADNQAKLEGIAWDEARVVSIGIRQDAYEPMVIRVRQNEPYVFRFVNRDDSNHVFRSPGFFSSVAIEKVSYPDQEVLHPCMVGLGIPADSTVNLHFVAFRDGRYEFEDPRFGVPILFAAGSSGVVYISTPRQTIESPTNLKVIEPPPAVPAVPGASRPGAVPGGPSSGFPIDSSSQRPGSPGAPGLPGDSGMSLPGDAPVGLPGDAPLGLPGDAPVRLPGDRVPTAPEDSGMMLPGDAPPLLPGDAPVRLPDEGMFAPPAPVQAPANRAASTPRRPAAAEGLVE